VGVIDHATITPENCTTSAVVSALSYWCQGKLGGCEIDQQLWKTVGRFCETEKPTIQVLWHQEKGFSSREIPCPSYGHGAMERKFSRRTTVKQL